MAEFLDKIQTNISDSSQRRVQDLGRDLMGLFGAVGSAVSTYDTIGEQAAKLKFMDDSRDYRINVAAINSSIDNNSSPEQILASKQAVEQLSGEFVSKGDAFKDHKAAFNAYNTAALDVTSGVVSSMQQPYNTAFLNATARDHIQGTQEMLNITSGDLAVSEAKSLISTEDSIVGNKGIDTQKTIASEHIAANDSKVVLMPDDQIVARVSDKGEDGNNVIVPSKLISLFNETYGASGLVEYGYDEKNKTYTFNTDVYTDEPIKNKYVDKISAIIKLVEQSNKATTYDNPAYNALVQNKQTFNLGDSQQSIEAKVSIVQKQLDTYRKARNPKGESNSQASEVASIAADMANSIAIYKSLSIQTAAGNNGDVSKAKYAPSVVQYNAETKAFDVVKLGPVQVPDDKKISFISGAISRTQEANVNGHVLDPTLVNIAVAYGGAEAISKATINSLQAGVSHRTLPEIEQYMSGLLIASQGMGEVDANMIASSTGVAQKLFSDFEQLKKKDPKANPQPTIDKINAELAQLSTVVKTNKNLTSEKIKNTKDKLLDNSILEPSTWLDFKVSDSTIAIANSMFRDKHRVDPSSTELASFIRDRAYDGNMAWLKDGLAIMLPDATVTDKKTGKQFTQKITSNQMDVVLSAIKQDPRFKGMSIEISNIPTGGSKSKVALYDKSISSTVPVSTYTGDDLLSIYNKQVVKNKKEKNKPSSVMDALKAL